MYTKCFIDHRRRRIFKVPNSQAHSLDALGAVEDVAKAVWKKCPSFNRALAYMVSRGCSEKELVNMSAEECNKLLGLA